jgi:CDGSH-type Zn-finger protein
MSEPVIAQTKPCHVDVEEGEQYAYCTCGLSDKQPF